MNLFAGPSNGSVPSFSGSVSAMSVRFIYGSVLVGPVRRFPVRFRGHPVKAILEGCANLSHGVPPWNLMPFS